MIIFSVEQVSKSEDSNYETFATQDEEPNPHDVITFSGNIMGQYIKISRSHSICFCLIQVYGD